MCNFVLITNKLIHSAINLHFYLNYKAYNWAIKLTVFLCFFFFFFFSWYLWMVCTAEYRRERRPRWRQQPYAVLNRPSLSWPTNRGRTAERLVLCRLSSSPRNLPRRKPKIIRLITTCCLRINCRRRRIIISRRSIITNSNKDNSNKPDVTWVAEDQPERSVCHRKRRKDVKYVGRETRWRLQGVANDAWIIPIPYLKWVINCNH